jgi:hypothetical protein
VTHPTAEGYYFIWVVDRNPVEAVQFFRNIDVHEEYRVLLSFEMEEKVFEEYVRSLYPDDQVHDPFMGYACRIPDYSIYQIWLDGFPAWKLEKERQKREYMMEQYQHEHKAIPQMKLF